MLKEYDPKKKLKIQRYTRQPGEKLDDDVVVNMIYLLHKEYAKMQFSVVDPLYQPAKNNEERWRPTVQNLLLRDQPDDIILMPLVKSDHWSMLVFIPSLSGFIHVDSIYGYHRKHAQSILKLIDDEEHAFSKRYRLLPVYNGTDSQQSDDWECGYFVLMNALMFLRMKKSKLVDERTLFQYLARHSPAVCEKNLARFSQHFYDIVSSRI